MPSSGSGETWGWRVFVEPSSAELNPFLPCEGPQALIFLWLRRRVPYFRFGASVKRPCRRGGALDDRKLKGLSASWPDFPEEEVETQSYEVHSPAISRDESHRRPGPCSEAPLPSTRKPRDPSLQKLSFLGSCELIGLRPCSEGRRHHSRGCLSSCCAPPALLKQNSPKKEGDSFTGPFASSREKADQKYIPQLLKRRQRNLQTKFLFSGHRLGEHIYFTYLCIINIYIFLLHGFSLREPSSGGKKLSWFQPNSPQNTR